MKKIFLMFIALFAICFTANAQQATCKVKGTDASVVVTVISWDKAGNVTLSFGSDCDRVVNVNYNIKFEARGDNYSLPSQKITSQPFNATVEPNKSTTKNVRVRIPNGLDLTNVTEINVSGTRCQ